MFTAAGPCRTFTCFPLSCAGPPGAYGSYPAAFAEHNTLLLFCNIRLTVKAMQVNPCSKIFCLLFSELQIN